jgi:hypothetical protein
MSDDIKIISIYKSTTDDWSPSYILENSGTKLVLVSMFECMSSIESIPQWGVSVWGCGEYGLEKRFNNRALASVCFDDVIRLPNITRFVIELLDFVPA